MIESLLSETITCVCHLLFSFSLALFASSGMFHTDLDLPSVFRRAACLSVAVFVFLGEAWPGNNDLFFTIFCTVSIQQCKRKQKKHVTRELWEVHTKLAFQP